MLSKIKNSYVWYFKSRTKLYIFINKYQHLNFFTLSSLLRHNEQRSNVLKIGIHEHECDFFIDIMSILVEVIFCKNYWHKINLNNNVLNTYLIQ